MHIRETFSKFFADRGTHLAAMIAYFALLSFVPLLFLSLALLGFTGRANERSYVVTELQRIFPGISGQTASDLIRTVQRNATSLGLVGGGFLLWSSLSLFSVLESAFNIVYARPNRPFLPGKARALAFMVAGVVTLFTGLVAGGLGAHLLNRFAPGFLGNTVVAHIVSVLASILAVFLFLVSSYLYLPNLSLRLRDVLPGTIVATVALEATFQVLPIYIGLSKHVPTAQAFGSPVLLLIWLYVMANVIVFGAEVNWRRSAAGAAVDSGQPTRKDRSRATPPQTDDSTEARSRQA